MKKWRLSLSKSVFGRLGLLSYPLKIRPRPCTSFTDENEEVVAMAMAAVSEAESAEGAERFIRTPRDSANEAVQAWNVSRRAIKNSGMRR